MSKNDVSDRPGWDGMGDLMRSGGGSMMDLSAWLIVFAAAAPLQRPDIPLPTAAQRAKVEAAAAQGRSEADAELQTDHASIWMWGLFLGDPVDRATGLPITGFGCVIDDELEARVAAHNIRLDEWIRAYGLPKNSLKPWEKELFGIKDYFEDRGRAGKVVRLTAGGPEITSPDGKYRIKLEPRAVEAIDPPEPGAVGAIDPLEPGAVGAITPTQRPGFVMVLSGSDASAGSYSTQESEVELAWGPVDSWFVALKQRGGPFGSEVFVAYDLRNRRILRTEIDRPRPMASEQR